MTVMTDARQAGVSIPSRQTFARRAFLWVSRTYAGAVFVQVFLAGMALMGAGLSIGFHREFAHVFLVLTVLQLGTLFVARYPRPIVLLTLALLGLLVLQGALIVLRPVSPVLTALHPVNAMVIPVTALALVRRTDTELRRSDPSIA